MSTSCGLRRLYVIRHCAAEGQAEDAGLTAEGRKQANLLAVFLMDWDIDAIVASPFRRAQQSIEPLANRLKLPIHADPRLAERVLSTSPLVDWTSSLQRTFDDFDLALEGGESSRIAMQRAVDAVNDALLLSAQNIVLVTHGNLMTLLLRHFDATFGFEAWRRLTNPDVFVVTLEGTEQRVQRIWRESN